MARFDFAALNLQVGEEFLNAFLLLFEQVVEALVDHAAVLLDEPLDLRLVETLVKRWVLSVHVDLPVSELQAFRGLLVEDDVEGDLLLLV